jgi:hypothetical protein
MKIRMIKFYQGVLMNGTTYTSFQPDDTFSDVSQRKNLSAKVLEQGVEISNAEMTCFVPFNNVAYVQYVKEDKPEPKPSKSK